MSNIHSSPTKRIQQAHPESGFQMTFQASNRKRTIQTSRDFQCGIEKNKEISDILELALHVIHRAWYAPGIVGKATGQKEKLSPNADSSGDNKEQIIESRESQTESTLSFTPKQQGCSIKATRLRLLD